MGLKIIRVSPATYTRLRQLSEAVMGLPVARVVEELARVDPLRFRRMIMKRMEALPSDAGDGSTGGHIGSTSQPRAGSAADAGDGSPSGDVRSTTRPPAGHAAPPKPTPGGETS